MRRKRRKKSHESHAGGYDHLASSDQFYAAKPSEQPLYERKGASGRNRTQSTGRHQTGRSRRKEGVDPRDKMALVAILRLVVFIIVLMIVFFLLKKGIRIYEESVWLENTPVEQPSPVMEELDLAGDFDIRDEESRQNFAGRIEHWREADRLVRSADSLLKRNNFDQAIEQCQEALRRDPAHRGALARLGELYYSSGDYVESVNAYIRLLSVDPSNAGVQKDLIKALVAFGDHDAVFYMAKWFLEQNHYDPVVQRYLADTFYDQGKFEEAAEAYNRAVADTPKDVDVLERQVAVLMQIGRYSDALVTLTRLREMDLENQIYYRNIAICQAQLRQSQKAVQTMGRSAQLFGIHVVVGWMQDPRFDPIRKDRIFQLFAERIGGEEFRKSVEKVADSEDAPDIGAKLEMPVDVNAQNKDLFLPTN
jgi:tetratricopeptide (TPR) repeat protein